MNDSTTESQVETFSVPKGVPLAGVGMTPELAQKNLGAKLAFLHEKTGKPSAYYLAQQMQVVSVAQAESALGMQLRPQLARDETRTDAPPYAAITVITYETTDPEMLRQENLRSLAEYVTSLGARGDGSVLDKVVPGSAGPAAAVTDGAFLALHSPEEVEAAGAGPDQLNGVYLSGRGDSPSAALWALGSSITELDKNPELGRSMPPGPVQAGTPVRNLLFDGQDFVAIQLVTIVGPSVTFAERVAAELSQLPVAQRTYAQRMVEAVQRQQAEAPAGKGQALAE